MIINELWYYDNFDCLQNVSIYNMMQSFENNGLNQTYKSDLIYVKHYSRHILKFRINLIKITNCNS